MGLSIFARVCGRVTCPTRHPEGLRSLRLARALALCLPYLHWDEAQMHGFRHMVRSTAIAPRAQADPGVTHDVLPFGSAVVPEGDVVSKRYSFEGALASVQTSVPWSFHENVELIASHRFVLLFVHQARDIYALLISR